MIILPFQALGMKAFTLSPLDFCSTWIVLASHMDPTHVFFLQLRTKSHHFDIYPFQTGIKKTALKVREKDGQTSFAYKPVL